MNRILEAWQSSFTRRWHNNFDLANSQDPISGHQGRVAVLMLQLCPEASRNALIAALTHDLGEGSYGDMAYDLKRAEPDMAKKLSDLEADKLDDLGIGSPPLTQHEESLLKMCDWLDAWLWMMSHARHLHRREDWQAQLGGTLRLACETGVHDVVAGLVCAAEGRDW